MKLTHTIAAFWQSYCQQAKLNKAEPDDVCAWGEGERMARELGYLIWQGKKLGGASLVWEFEYEAAYQPKPGEFTVVTSFEGTPFAVIETTQIDLYPFKDVPASFAQREGEGPGERAGTLEFWREAHWEFFSDVCKRIGREPTQDMMVLCESFELRYKSSHYPE